MDTNIIARVSSQGILEIPDEVLVKLQPLTEYEVLIKEDEIVFKKIPKQLAWAELSAKISGLGEDAKQPSLQEISEIVREIKRERYHKP